jgi:hypothetical protein
LRALLPLVALLAPAWAGALAAPPLVAWHDTPATRLAALALVESLDAELLASPSATLVLEHWCATHGLADPARLQAEQLASQPDDVDAATRRDLEVEPRDLVIHRRVALRCGTRLLSVADNWYVPSRLSQEMNQQLEHTQEPFGKVVQSLQPYRRTLSARLLWSPLGEGWELATGPGAGAAREGHAESGRLDMPQELFEHRALMSGADHRPIAELRETYQRGLLDFPEPVLR